MYKYYSELENPKNFKIYLEETRSAPKKHIFDKQIPNDFFSKYSTLFRQLSFLHTLIQGWALERKLQFNMSNEEYLFLEKCEEEHILENILQTLSSSNLSDLKFLLMDYYHFAQFFISLLPNFQNFLKEISINLSRAICDISYHECILISSTKKIVECYMPNAWYITPHGYLYNTGIQHKEGNLTYSFWDIFGKLNSEKIVSCPENYSEKIRNILAREFVSGIEFRAYANSIYKLPTIYTPHIQKAMELAGKNMTYIERSYQPNIIKLTIGFLDAKSSLYRSFEKLNAAKKKALLAKKLEEFTLHCKEKLLIRFAGFHKIESCERKITTSSLYGIRDFKEYLDKGWDLYIVPSISYDKILDEIFEMDLNEYFISNFLDEELKDYKGKGNVLIRDKNC